MIEIEHVRLSDKQRGEIYFPTTVVEVIPETITFFKLMYKIMASKKLAASPLPTDTSGCSRDLQQKQS
jgi:hypothetical protein